MAQAMIGVIGGSGVYGVEGLEDAAWRAVDSPWGAPSDAVLCGTLAGVPVAFLPRHGRGHVQSPTSINYRANIDALKRLGVTDVISISAVGSFREEMAPGDFVIVDQFIDRTFAREKSFFGPGCVAHVSVAEPVCPRLGDALQAACGAIGQRVHRGGTYLCMEGPQFSSRAESVLHKGWGCSVVGMTNMPEAKLAREAELCYATVAMVTDYDAWREGHDAVDVASVIKVMQGNAEMARALVKQVVPALGGARAPCRHGCDRALDFAVITAAEKRDAGLAAKLDAVAGRVL
jgi:5'-methylthioadenosine phosphorylase